MKQIIGMLLIIMTYGCQVNVPPANMQTTQLYPIIENGLWGYIDQSGKTIIVPKFRSAGQFSEGLAPVRLNGTYGYIDKHGEFVIQPKYDVAYSFEKGQAKVYLKEKPYFIDKAGKLTFEHNFSDIQGFGKNDFSIVSTKAKNHGVINRKGELLTDTIYNEISAFSEGFAVVTGHNHEPYPRGEKEPVFEIGVINPNNDFLIPFGKYKEISKFKNGFAKVELDVEYQQNYYDHEGVIDTNGNLKFIIPATKWHFDYGNEDFSEGLATVGIYLVDPNTVKSSPSRDSYKGVINTEGKIVFSNKDWDKITPFKYNRAFVQDVKGDWYLVDRKGQILNEDPYQEILYETHSGNPDYLFQKKLQFVKTDTGWGAIDTNAVFVLEPKNDGYDYRDSYWRGEIIFIEKDISIGSDKYSYQYGFWNTKIGTIVEPQFHDIEFAEFKEELIYVMQDDRIGYIDHEGNYIWRASKKGQHQTDFNIDYMNRGYFYASSPYKKELARFGGWGKSRNSFKEISEPKKFEKEKLNLIVNPSDKGKYLETFDGIKLYIANTTKDTLFFAAQDSRLYLKIQAKDIDGEWKDIEYTPSSWCGNSYHTLFLPPTYFWEFTTPVYQGEFNTLLRAQLLYKGHKKQKEDHIIYSNEFSGGVNPGQFWRKQGYYSSGIMDPYNN